MRKIFSAVIALLLCASLLFAVALAAAEAEPGEEEIVLPALPAEDIGSATDSGTDTEPTPAPTAEPASEPDSPTDLTTLKIVISEDGGVARVMGDFTGLYARVALIIDNNGQTGLYVTQVPVNDEGSIVVPTFMVPGLAVLGVNIALVGSLEDISSPMPKVIASGFMYY